MLKLSLVILLLVHFSSSQEYLNATECASKLLSPRSDVGVAYDGEDTIYIFGGLFWTPEWELVIYDEIHAFNLTSDEIRVVSRTPRTAHGGKAQYRREYGDILYLRADGTFLWSFNVSSGETVSVTEWTQGAAGSTMAFMADKVMAFGGLLDATSIFTLDLFSLQQGFTGVLPLKSELSMGLHIPHEQTTYIFAGELGDRAPQLMRYHHLLNATEILPWTFPSWRHGDGSPTFNSRDGCIYIVGAVVDNGARGDGFIKINISTGEVTFVELQGTADLLTATNSVYVEKLNRIYVIGGYDNSNIDRDEIWYIQL